MEKWLRRVRFLKRKIANLESKLIEMEKKYYYQRTRQYLYFVHFKASGPIYEYMDYVDKWIDAVNELQALTENENSMSEYEEDE